MIVEEPAEVYIVVATYTVMRSEQRACALILATLTDMRRGRSKKKTSEVTKDLGHVLYKLFF